jgi:arylsulfatase A-like enzyme
MTHWPKSMVWAASAAIAGACFLLTACDRGPIETPSLESPKRVVFVVVDTLRKDHMGVYGYEARPTTPNLDAIAAQGVAWPQMVGVTSWTMPSMATLFTGMAPHEHGVMRLTSLYSRLTTSRTLANLYRDAGYSTGCMMSNFLLLKARRNGFYRGFDVFDDSLIDMKNPHGGSSAADVTSAGIKWVKSLPADKPWLLVLHYFDPHSAYLDHATYDWQNDDYTGWVKSGLPVETLRQHADSATAADRAQLNAYYDEEIRTVDDEIGRFVAFMKESGQWDDTLFVMTADHGEELAERGHIGHTTTLHPEQTSLPLIARWPGGAPVPAKWATGKSQLDIFPFLLGAIGLDEPARPESAFVQSEVDFVPIRQEHQDKYVRLRRLAGERFSLTVDLLNHRELLFDLQNDAREQVNLLADDEQALAVEAQAALADLRAAMQTTLWWEPKASQ